MVKILSENLKLIMIGLVSILMIIALAIVISLYFGGEVSRTLTITEINGNALISRGIKTVNASKGFSLKSGDVVSTDKKSSLRISIDDNKFILVEPDTSIYIYFTDIASKGDISVNVSKGAVLCSINEKLSKNASFVLKTPNSTIDVKGTVFRAEFDYLDEYIGYQNVMVTQVQNFEGSVNLQLYDVNQEAQNLPMVLTERTSAQLLTAENLCQYGYLNYSFDLTSMDSIVLGELIRAQKYRTLAFTPDEISAAYKIASDEERRLETMTETSSEAETTTVTTTKTTTQTTTESTTTPPPETETESETYDTLPTTGKTYAYTTYSGIKWWEITGNSNTGTDDYEDWFPVDGEETSAQETVTAGTSSENE